MRTLYGIIKVAPITREAPIIDVDIDWNLGDAAIVADTTGGQVVAARLGPWRIVSAGEVEAALKASAQAAVATELDDLLRTDGGDDD